MVMNATGQTPATAAIGTQHVKFESFYREHLPFIRLYLARRVEVRSLSLT